MHQVLRNVNIFLNFGILQIIRIRAIMGTDLLDNKITLNYIFLIIKSLFNQIWYFSLKVVILSQRTIFDCLYSCQ